MNLQNICDILQSIAIALLCILGLLQNREIKRLRDDSNMQFAYAAITRSELGLQLIPPKPEEDEE